MFFFCQFKLFLIVTVKKTQFQLNPQVILGRSSCEEKI